MRKPIIAVVGRPNVGKSTLFNRIVRERKAIVDDQPGVTRDRIHAQAEWNKRNFIVVDTGGYVPRDRNQMELLVKRQVELAMDEADLILLVVDVQTGVTDFDAELAHVIQRSSRRCLLVVNKVDSDREMADVSQFYRLGLGAPIPVSALTGRRSGDLLDEVVSHFPPYAESEEDSRVKIAILGRPNVGKSTFLNALLGRDEVIVDSRPGTTRDSIDTLFVREGREYLLIDTAGLRRRAKIRDEIEFYSSVRAVRSLERCDVALVLMDATDGCTNQDGRILSQAMELGKGVVLVVNKWDKIEKDSHTAGEFVKEIRWRLPFADHLPIIFTSALTRQRVHKAVDLAFQVYQNRRQRVPTSQLNKFLEEIKVRTPPSRAKLFYCTQQGTEPPAFVFFANDPGLISENYRKFLERKIRENFGFEGTPMRISLRKT